MPKTKIQLCTLVRVELGRGTHTTIGAFAVHDVALWVPVRASAGGHAA